MSTAQHASANHGNHDDGAVHAHVSSIPFYVAIFLGLLFLTGMTVGQSYVDLGKLNIVLVILIATMKASLVVTFFMHLRWDSKFNTLIFLSTLFFIGVFFAYTMNDVDRRGDLDPDQNMRVLQKTGEDAPGGMPAPEAHGGAAPGASGAAAGHEAPAGASPAPAAPAHH